MHYTGEQAIRSPVEVWTQHHPVSACYDHEAFERFLINTILHGDFNSQQYSQTLKHGDCSELGEDEEKRIYVAEASFSFYGSFYLLKV